CLKKQVDSWEKDFKNEASYVLRLDDMIEGLSEAGRMKRHVEELDCKDKEYLESTLARVNTTMIDRLGWSDAEEHSTNVIDVLTIYGSTPPPGPQDPSHDS
nr:hypothetical protein [Tanacetum cinerariifolium]